MSSVFIQEREPDNLTVYYITLEEIEATALEKIIQLEINCGRAPLIKNQFDRVSPGV